MSVEAGGSASAAPAPAAPAPAAPGPAAAAATPGAPAPAPAEGAQESSKTITLKVTLGDSTLDADAIERAIEAELETSLERTDSSADLELSLGGGRVVARAKGTEGRVIERSMTLPPAEEEQLQIIALLSENLLRDEASAVLSALPATGAGTPAKKEDTGPFWPVGVSVIRGVSLPSKDANVAFTLSLLDGQWRSLTGLGISGISQSWTAHSTGLSIAGIFHEAASFDGLTIAGIYDATTNVEGLRRGLSIGGLASRSAGDMIGLQIGGLLSSARAFSGLQIGGLMSSAPKGLQGLQIGGFNQAGMAKYGMQVGVVNYAEQGGIQVGLVNIRRKGDGPQVGLIGIGPETRMQLTTWIQGLNLGELEGGMPTGPTANIGIRIQTKYFVSMAHLGFGAETTGCGAQNNCGTGAALLIPGYTVGGRLPFSKVWSAELDVQHRLAAADTIYSPDMVALRGSVVARVHPMLAIFAAAGPEFVFPTVGDAWVREHLALGVQVF